MSAKEGTKIVCKAQRPGGSKIEVFGERLHFKPESDAEGAPHVAIVTKPEAIHRLLSILEGDKSNAFYLADKDATIPPKPKADPGQTMGNEKPKDPNAPKDVIITSDDGQEINLSAMQPAELRQLAKDTFGIAVHNKWSDATVIAKIVEKTRNEG